MKILITGATSGIGHELAKIYRQGNHEIIALGRNQEGLKNLEKMGIETWRVDLSNLEISREIFKAIEIKHGHLDLALLNAGNCEYIDCQNFDAQLIKRVFDANVITLANSIEGVLPLLRKSNEPHLAGVASMAAYLPFSRAEAYGASKVAVNYLLEALAIDIIDENITVSIINPGFVKTPLTDKNDFPMPFVLEAEEAARIIVRGIAARKSEIHFPLRLTLPMKLLSLFPRTLWRKIGQKFKK
jgi:short-subunit dehydrogenase